MKKLLIVIAGLMLLLSTNSYAKKKTVIRIGMSTTGAGIEATKYQINEYTKMHPDVEIKISQLPASVDEALAIFLQIIEAKSGEIDILPVDAVTIGTLGPALIDFNKYNVGNITKTMFPILVENNIYNGKLVALPWYATPSVLYYRTDLLKKYNLPVPKTWNDLTRSAYIIQKGERKAGNPDFVGYVWQGDAYEGLTCNALEWINSNGGGNIVNSKKEITINNQNAIDAVNLAAAWIGTISPKGTPSMKEEECRHTFQGGNAAFMRNWPYAYPLCNSKNSKIKGKFEISQLPAGNSGKSADVVGACMIGVNKYSKNPEAAVDFAKFLLSEKMQKYRTITTGYGPTIMSLYHDKDILKMNPAFAELYEVFNSAIMRPSTILGGSYGNVSKEFAKAVYSVLTKTSSAQPALAEFAKKASDITGFPIKKQSN